MLKDYFLYNVLVLFPFSVFLPYSNSISVQRFMCKGMWGLDSIQSSEEAVT